MAAVPQLADVQGSAGSWREGWQVMMAVSVSTPDIPTIRSKRGEIERTKSASSFDARLAKTAGGRHCPRRDGLSGTGKWLPGTGKLFPDNELTALSPRSRCPRCIWDGLETGAHASDRKCDPMRAYVWCPMPCGDGAEAWPRALLWQASTCRPCRQSSGYKANSWRCLGRRGTRCSAPKRASFRVDQMAELPAKAPGSDESKQELLQELGSMTGRFHR